MLTKQKLIGLLVGCLASGTGMLSEAPSLFAQFGGPPDVRDQQVLFAQFQVQQALNGAFGNASELSDADSSQIATLKTDPDLELILEKAERFASDENWTVATKLWQAVLDRSGDAMWSEDGILYYSLAEQVERKLASLPPEALQAYRVRADADARAILAAAGDGQQSQALGRVVGSYFVSSIGDDAAFESGCLKLDRYDFVGALRLFEKLVHRYPDSDIPKDQVHLRIALCHAFLGNSSAADEAITAAEKSLAGGATAAGVVPDQLRGSMDQLTVESVSAMTDKAIRMRLAGPQRHGVMPELPGDSMNRDLAAVWQFYVEPKKRYGLATANGRTLIGRNSHGDYAQGTRNDGEKELIESWRKKDWRPAGHVLFADDRIYFKAAADVAVWDRKSISEISFGATEKTKPIDWVAWRSVWRNAFKTDAATEALLLMRRNGGYQRNRRQGAQKSRDPQEATEIQFFGDQIYQQMSICDEVLYAIEGDAYDDSTPLAGRSRRTRFQYDMSVRRVRKNRLTAYSADTGRLQWSLPREPAADQQENEPDESAARDSAWLESGGFMAAPVGFDGLVLVPVSEGGAVVVYALDPEQEGKTVWKSYLCDEPETGAVPWSPIQLSLEGSDLFVNTGLGAVFVLDASTGKIQFARRYLRKGTSDTSFRAYRQRARLKFDGWSSDVVVPWQNQLICFGSDTDTIFAIDRSTGRAVWNCPMNPIGQKVDYLLGVRDGTLYAAGPKTIIAYDLSGEGRMVWGADELFDGKTSQGRGMLTEDAIYIPVDNGIYKYNLRGKNGKAQVVAKVGVNLGTDAPVGNLYSDGQRIWVHGANRLYALGPNMDN